MEKTEKEKNILRIGWAHYPHLAPGETWESPEFIIYPHQGNWQRGAEFYRQFVNKNLAPASPTKYLKETLGLRSVFMTYCFGEKANFRYQDLPLVAKDALKHGIKEMVIWFWGGIVFDFSMRLNPQLGTEEDLRKALQVCRKMGVNVTAFIGGRAIRPELAPEEWFEHDSEGRKRYQSYTYSPDFVPWFNPPYYNFNESAFICPASKGWQKAFLESCRDLRHLGFSSICFDQIFSHRLCYNKSHNHKPQKLARYLYQVLREVSEEGRKIDPEATFSGEYFTDITQQFQHYSWDWVGGVKAADFAPFRYVFPRFRMTFLVDRSLRWLHEGFTHGLWLNFFPRDGEGYIGEDKNFSKEVQRLAKLRRNFSHFFESGDYLGEEVLKGNFEIACAYRWRSEGLIIVTNPKKKETPVEIKFPIKELFPLIEKAKVKVFRENVVLNEEFKEKGKSFTFKETLRPNELILIHLTKED